MAVLEFVLSIILGEGIRTVASLFVFGFFRPCEACVLIGEGSLSSWWLFVE